MWNGDSVRFTAEDLDTLRHEALHVAQDCVDGEMTGSLDLVIKDQELLTEIVARFGVDKMKHIVELYKENGADARTVMAEVEAWSAAGELPAQFVVESLRFYCN